MVDLPELSVSEYQFIYNSFSFTLSAMLGSFIFFMAVRDKLAPRYRSAILVAAIAAAIAGYHYFRLYESIREVYAIDERGVYVPTGLAFNNATRYIEWLLTVPLLVAELALILNLPGKERRKLVTSLIGGGALVIALGYPGEIASTNIMRAVHGVLSMIPFVYVVMILWYEVSEDQERQTDEELRKQLYVIRLLLISTWIFYPIAYALPLFGISASASFIWVQSGYAIADVLAKCVYGILIYMVARRKTLLQEPESVGLSAQAATAAAD